MAAQPFVIYKEQTLCLSIMASGFYQQTEGLHKQDTDGGNPQGECKWQKSSAIYCCWPLGVSCFRFETDKRLRRGPSRWDEMVSTVSGAHSADLFPPSSGPARRHQGSSPWKQLSVWQRGSACRRLWFHGGHRRLWLHDWLCWKWWKRSGWR